MGSEARARLGLAGLLAITLFSFNQVFATGDYPGPALLGILIAVAVAMVGRRLGAGSVLTIAGSLVIMVAYLCLVFQADKTFRGLPSPRALEGLWRSLQHAYTQSQVDFSPVPPRPGYVVMVVAGLWLAALLGEIAAFRWRRPLLASLPCIGLFALIMVVGTGQAAPLLVALFLIALFAFWGLESSHRLRAWGRWVPTWKEHESEPEPTEVTGSLARRMGAACVLMGLVVPLFLPALGDGLLVWRNPTGEGLPGGGGGEGGALDPLVSVRPQLINQPETVLFEVTSLRPSYWRLLTYTQFDGVSWQGSSRADRPSQFGAISTDMNPETVTRVVKASFVMRALEGERLPTTGLPREVEFTGSNAEEYESGLSYDAESGDVEMEQRIVDGLRYEVRAVLPEASFRNLSRAAPGEIENPTYRQLPKNLSDVVFETANEWTEGIDNPFRQLVAIQNRLRSFDYSLNVEDTGSDDYLGDFLTVTRRGFCQQFASAFAILARLKGFSTRVVVGFLPGTTDLSAPTNYSVRGTHAHVWPEAYFQGYGWVPFEPTPRGPAPPPAYTVPGGFGEGARPEFQIAGGRQNRDLQGRLRPLGNEPINPGGIEQAPPRTDRVNLEWKKTFTRIALFLTILALAYLVVTPAWKLRRISSRYRRARDSRARAAAAFAHFQEEAGDLVSRKAPAESATAYATRLAKLRKVPERPALRLASIYEASEYASTETSAKDASEARHLARQLRSTIWGGASWWGRGQRLFSPVWNGRKVA